MQPHRCRIWASPYLLATKVHVLCSCFISCMRHDELGMLECGGVCCVDCVCASLMPCADHSNAVDIFNVTSGVWSTAALSEGRGYLAATSLPNVGVAIFAGTCCHVDLSYSSRVVLFWLGNRMLEWAEAGLLIACASLMPCAGGGIFSNAVDIFNAASGTWSTAALSVARPYLAATSLPNHGIAIFAGGQSTCCHVDFRILRVLCCFGWGLGCLSGRKLVC